MLTYQFLKGQNAASNSLNRELHFNLDEETLDKLKILFKNSQDSKKPHRELEKLETVDLQFALYLNILHDFKNIIVSNSVSPPIIRKLEFSILNLNKKWEIERDSSAAWKQLYEAINHWTPLFIDSDFANTIKNHISRTERSEVEEQERIKKRLKVE